jgi:hypothetical protein
MIYFDQVIPSTKQGIVDLLQAEQLTSEEEKHVLRKEIFERFGLTGLTSIFSGDASGRFGAHIRIISARQMAAYN